MSPRTSPLSKLNRKSVRIPLALAAAAAAIGTAAGSSLGGPAPAPAVSRAAAHAVSPAQDAAARQLFADVPAPYAVRTGTVKQVTAKRKRAAGAPARASAKQQVRGVAGQGHRQHRVSHRRRCHSSGLHRWICQAENIMVRHGVPRSEVSPSAAMIVVLHESGGNPHASNGWDANAAAGTPSEGIAQTIDPTFRTYALPGHHDIWNPVDNMIAAFRYAISQYGSMNNIPGVVSVRRGGPYLGY